MHYGEGVKIEPYLRTVWCIEFETGATLLQVWHENATIEEVVSSSKLLYRNQKFTVSVVDVGTFSFVVDNFTNYMSNGLKLNQDMQYVI